MSKWVNDFWLVGAYTEILNITFPKCVWFYSITSNEYNQMAGIVKSFPGWGWISVWDITSVAWRWTLYVPSSLIFLYSRLLKCIYMQWLITFNVVRKVFPREVNSERSKSSNKFDFQSQETSGFYACLSLSQLFLLSSRSNEKLKFRRFLVGRITMKFLILTVTVAFFLVGVFFVHL